MRKAILIPANPKRSFKKGGDEGSIIAHARKIEDEGAVYWPLVVPGTRDSDGFLHEDIKTAYLYDVSEKRITHMAEVAWIKSIKKIGVNELNRYCLAQKRWEGRDRECFYIVKMLEIYALKRVHQCFEFKKCDGGENVERVMNYCIVRERNYAHHDKHVTRGEILSNHIAELFLLRGVLERDIENLFYYRLMKNYKIIKRQGAFKKAGRLDLMVKSSTGDYIIYELKRGVASIRTLQQIQRYMSACSKEKRIPMDQINGVILAQDADPDLRDELRSKLNKNIKFKRYYFSIDMR